MKCAFGTYVEVMGRLSYLTMTLTAESVSIWADWDKKISAMGVVVRVVSTGAEPVFQVDGYPVRIAHNTKTIFGEGLGTMDDVGTNTWLRFQGRRGKDGVVEAAKAIFLPAKLDKTKAAGGHETEIQKGKVKLGNFSGWYAIVTDTAMQERIVRVGMRVLPQYQQKLADDDPSKIHIQFYAVDAAKVHSEMCSADAPFWFPSRCWSGSRATTNWPRCWRMGWLFNCKSRQQECRAAIGRYLEFKWLRRLHGLRIAV